MSLRFAWLPCVVLSSLLLSQPAPAETGKEAFASGQSLLASGDLPGALKQFSRAARAAQNNREYAQQYALVRQAITLRDGLAKQSDPERWEYMGRALHSFYISQGLYQDALALDRQMHAKLNTAQTAVTLAETALALDRGAEAADVLAKLAPEEQTPGTRALHGLAVARQGRADEARRIAKSLSLPDNTSPSVLYAAARLHAASGDAPQACALLVRCFEGVAPSQLERFKEQAKKSVEFTSLIATPEFTQTLQTKSKVPESQCSSGSRCSSCPMRAKCAGQSAKE
jgi:Flp pilus assembly protein TadD